MWKRNWEKRAIKWHIRSKDGKLIEPIKLKNVIVCVDFNKSNPYWHEDPTNTRDFLFLQEDLANEILKLRGQIDLEEVLNMVGIRGELAKKSEGYMWSREIDKGCHVQFGYYRGEYDSTIMNEYNNFILGKSDHLTLRFNPNCFRKL